MIHLECDETHTYLFKSLIRIMIFFSISGESFNLTTRLPFVSVHFTFSHTYLYAQVCIYGDISVRTCVRCVQGMMVMRLFPW